MAEPTISNNAAFIWSVADLLRGDYKQSEYGKVILPLTVLRRLDCVLKPTKAAVLKRYDQLKGQVDNIDPVLESVAKERFFNISKMDFMRLLDDPGQIAGNLRGYIAGFSEGARQVIEKFAFDNQITELDKKNLLYLVISKFAEINLHPDAVSNIEMGYLYEELIRKFSELSNETAGEHFTPREVIRLMVNLLFSEDDDILTNPGVIKTLFDPACGTGGMLSVSEDHLRSMNPTARLEVFGEEVNDETYAVCRSDMMLKGQDASRIIDGNSFSEDGHQGRTFDYMLANPPFGVEWKKVEDAVKTEAETLGFAGRFGAGLPRDQRWSLPLPSAHDLQNEGTRGRREPNRHRLQWLAAIHRGGRFRRVRNQAVDHRERLAGGRGGSAGPAFLQHRHLHLLLGRNKQEVFPTKGKVQLVDAREYWLKMPKSLGDKRKMISPEQIAEVTRLYGEFTEGERVKILPNEAFGYQRITVERPLRVRWEVTPDTLRVVAKTKAWAQLDDADKDGLEASLSVLVGTTTTDRKVLASKLGSVPKAVEKALWGALAVSDREAPVVTNRKRQLEPDPSLRDNENVPLPTVPVTWKADQTERLASVEYRRAVDEYMTARGAALRPRCLGGLGQDEDRLRNPADPILLQVRSTTSARRY